MVQDIDKYAKMAGSLGISASVLEQTQGIFEAVPEIMQDFSNPANELTAKHNVIDRVFPTEIRSFLKLLCDEDAITLFPDICVRNSSRGSKNLSAGRAEQRRLTSRRRKIRL